MTPSESDRPASEQAQSRSNLLSRRVVLVTGAAGAIGAGICRSLTDHGALCVPTDVRGDGAIHVCDVTDPESVSAVFDAAPRDAAVTDVIHAAGVVSGGSVLDTDPAEFRRVIEINLTGSFIVAREAARRLPDGGTITFVASQAGLKGGALWSAYSASKAGVIRLAECLAQELGPRQIRVNAVCPGNVDTPMATAAVARLSEISRCTPEAIRERYLSGIPLGRFAQPEEIGDLCVFLTSPLAGYVSGAALLADGAEVSG